MKVYIVKGHTGEHGDYLSWPVVCYTDLERAVHHRDLANEWAKQLGGVDWEGATHWLALGSNKVYENIRAVFEGKLICPHDPRFRLDYTGTQYMIVAIDLDPEDLGKLEPPTILGGD